MDKSSPPRFIVHSHGKRAIERKRMSTMNLQILIAFIILLALGILNIAKHRLGKPTIPLAYFWLALITCLFVVLSVGLVQVHFDCMWLWGEYYARYYPSWIMAFKPLLLWSPSLWTFGALACLLLNVLRLIRDRFLGRDYGDRRWLISHFADLPWGCHNGPSRFRHHR